MTPLHLSRKSQGGVSILSAVIGIGIACLIAVGISNAVTNGIKGQRSVELRGDLSATKTLLLQYLDCGSVFANPPGNTKPINASAPGASCTSSSKSQTGPYLQLYRQTANGPRALGKWDAACDVTRLGAYALRTTCSESEQSLVVRAARLDVACHPLTDPLTGKSMDFDSPRALLIGDEDGAVPMCFPSRSRDQIHKFELSIGPSHFAQTLTPPCEGNNICAGPMNVSYTSSLVPRGTAGWPKFAAPTNGNLVLSIQGHSNWDGGSIIEFTNLTASLIYRVNSGGWQTLGSAAGVVHNGGGPFNLSSFLGLNAGDVVEVTPQFLFQQGVSLPYSGGGGTWLFVTAWSVFGTLTLHFLENS